MTGFPSPSPIILGSGGPRPAAFLFDWQVLDVHPLFETGPTGSVYTAGASPDGRFVAAGTKAGNLHILDRGNGSTEPVVLSLPCYSSYLSLCFISNTELVTSDTGGRIVHWSMEDVADLPVIHQSPSPVCCLVHTGEFLVTLSIDGEILFWELPGLTKFRSYVVSPPAKPFGAVCGCFLTTSNQIVFPTSKGKLVLLEVLSGDLTEIQAHGGHSITAFSFDDGIITAGRTDGLLKLWKVENGQCEKVWRIDAGVLTGCQLPTIEDAILVIDVEGKACIYKLEENRADLMKEIGGDHYRSLLSLAANECLSVRDARKIQEAHQIKERLEIAFDSSDNIGISQLLSRLEKLGFLDAVWEFKARQAEKDGDFLRELKIREMLSSQLPDEPGSIPSLKSHADLLGRAGFLKKARNILDRITGIADDESIQQEVNHLDRLFDLNADGTLVFHPDMEMTIPMVIAMANLLGLPFSNRTSVQILQPIPCRGKHVSPLAVLERLEHIHPQEGIGLLTQPRIEQVMLADFLMVGTHSPSLVCSCTDASMAGVEWHFLFEDFLMETVIWPVVVFNPECFIQQDDPLGNNQKCLLTFELHQKSAQTRSWFDHIYRCFRSALSREISQLQGRDRNKNACTESPFTWKDQQRERRSSGRSR